MMQIILDTLYLMAPAYAANMAPVIFQWIPWGGSPIDGGRKWRERRLLGDHKTYRGFVAGTLAAAAVALIQQQLGWQIPTKAFSIEMSILFGALFGFGALLGDSIKSFFKRQVGVPSGGAWPPFDQLDFVIGGLLFVSILYVPPLPIIMTALVLTPLLHLLTNLFAYSVGLKKVWW